MLIGRQRAHSLPVPRPTAILLRRLVRKVKLCQPDVLQQPVYVRLPLPCVRVAPDLPIDVVCLPRETNKSDRERDYATSGVRACFSPFGHFRRLDPPSVFRVVVDRALSIGRCCRVRPVSNSRARHCPLAN